MDLSRIRTVLKLEYLLLLLAMGLAFYIAYIPNINYPYPVHIDEWRSLAYFETISQSGTISIEDPFIGGDVGFIYMAEMGFHLFWSVFHQISGIPWMTIFRYFPSIIFMITVLSVYVLARRKNFGWEAAFFTCLIITTVGILGPAFLVPVSLALLFIPLILFIAFNSKNVWSYLVIFIFTSFLVSETYSPAILFRKPRHIWSQWSFWLLHTHQLFLCRTSFPERYKPIHPLYL